MRLRRRIPLPAPLLGAGWREAEFCVLDLETTGLDLRRDEIVSYGAAIVRQARIPCARVAYAQVRPRRPSSVAALRVHGLRGVDLAGAAPIDDVLDDIIDLLSGRVLVAHAAWLERAFLNRVLRHRHRRLPRATIDTAALARSCGLAGPPIGAEPSLEALAVRLRLPVHTPHHALGDAFTTAEVFLALATRIEREAASARSPLSVRRLCALSRRYSRYSR